ncbi:unnamed protein product [Rotaria socialis]
MNQKSLRIEVKVPGWNLMALDTSLNEVKKDVLNQLHQQNLTTTEAVVTKSCKNALSLVRSKKNHTGKSLIVYIPQNSIDNKSACNANSISSMRVRNEENSRDESILNEKENKQVSSELKFNFTHEKGLIIESDFVHLKNIFSKFLSRSSLSIDLNLFINEICAYCFNSSTKYYVNISETRREICSRLSYFVRSAKKKAKVRHTTVITVLSEYDCFTFYIKSVESVQRTDELLPLKFETYASINSSDHVLLVRDNDQVCIQSGNTCLYMYISESFAFRGLEQFDLSRIVDIDELLDMIESYCQLRNLQLDIEKNKDNLKTSILNTRVEMNQSKIFTCTIDLVDQYLCPQTDVVFDLDTLLGPVYATRGIKRKHQEVPSDTESNVLDVYDDEQDELWESTSGSSAKSDRNKTKNGIVSPREELLRKFLHIKDEYHITDSAIRAMHAFFKETKESFYSISEIERVQKKANKNIPLEYTKDSAYVPFEFALRAAVFVAIKFRPDLLKLNHLSFRLNMDGTLMGNKHVVAISVNCVDGGLCCQTAKKLVPVGIFEIQKESNELLRQTLPKRFLDSIQSVKQLQINKKKSATIKVRLGGDYQNAVYVFGLAGVHSNYPCVFCTQNKTYLHVTEKNTVCDEEVWVGSGKNRKKEKRTMIVNPTSIYDQTLGARTLQEKRECLKKK